MATATVSKILDAFEKATDIPSNTDMNNLNKPGVYGCASSSVAGTLSHCPVSAAFSLIVTATSISVPDTSATGKRQMLFGSSSIYLRGATTGGWGSWYKFTGAQV